MKRKFLVFLIASILISGFNNLYPQSKLEQILADVSQNNKSIKANKQYWETKKIEFQTGLYPNNPIVGYGNFPGTTSSIGTKQTFQINQSFNFPTAYIHQKRLADQRIEQADNYQRIFAQEVLLEAKKLYLELIYLNKLNIELLKRKDAANSLYEASNQKLLSGDGSQLEVNKAKLTLINFQNRLRINENQLNTVGEKLKLLNGGIAISINDTTFPEVVIKELDQILTESNEQNPVLKKYQADNEIGISNLKLSKSLYLPDFKVGYGSETDELNQSFRGIQFGISIPLWENSKTINHAKEKIILSDYLRESYLNEINSQITQLYQKTTTLKLNMEELKSAMDDHNSIPLLDKSLELGQISLIDYLLEIRYFYEIYDNYLSLEKEYYQILTELYKYEL